MPYCFSASTPCRAYCRNDSPLSTPARLGLPSFLPIHHGSPCLCRKGARKGQGGRKSQVTTSRRVTLHGSHHTYAQARVSTGKGDTDSVGASNRSAPARRTTRSCLGSLRDITTTPIRRWPSGAGPVGPASSQGRLRPVDAINSFRVSAGRFASFHVLSRRQIRCFRRSS